MEPQEDSLVASLAECRVRLRTAAGQTETFPVEAFDARAGRHAFRCLVPTVPQAKLAEFCAAKVDEVTGCPRGWAVHGYTETGIPRIAVGQPIQSMGEIPAQCRVVYRDSGGQQRSAVCAVAAVRAVDVYGWDLTPVLPVGVTKADVVVYEYTQSADHPRGLQVRGEAAQ